MRKLSTTVILGVLLGVLAVPAFATSGDCDVFENHSGHIPGSYDYARFYEDGQFIVEVNTNGEDIFVNPEGWDAGDSWDKVKKCDRPDTTTTTLEETTTTVDTTTSTVPDTTTTIGTSTTVESITTTAPVTSTSPTTTAPELPFTGPVGVVGLLVAGLAAVGIGVVLVREFRTE